MRLFGAKNDGEAETLAQQRQEASIQSLTAGGLPLDAIDRLKEQASRQGTDKHFFTSDLSVNEFLLSQKIGYEPLGLVMGSSVYNIGWQFLSNTGWWGQSGELEVMTAAHSEVRRLAMNRMQQEAALLGADGIIGVRITQAEMEGSLTEFMAVGTAVKHAQGRKPGDLPFLSGLSGQDTWNLEKAGFAPAGFAFGTCTYFQATDWRGQTAMMSWNNIEMQSLTQGFYTAREIAMERLCAEFEGTSADGIVGVEVDTQAVPYTDSHDQLQGLVVHFTAFGTAICRIPERVDINVKLTLPLIDG
jgi:uncharacterized protein YbjQ (UPF0145 family)